MKLLKYLLLFISSLAVADSSTTNSVSDLLNGGPSFVRASKAAGVPQLQVTSGIAGINIAPWSTQYGLGGNSIDPVATGVTLFGGVLTSNTFPSGTVFNNGANSAGKNIPANAIPIYTSGVGNSPADTYTPAGRATYSFGAGYDNILNGLMSVVIGSHSATYSATVHSYVIGSNSFISGASDANVVLNNRNSIDTSQGSGILSGQQNRIQGGGNYNVITHGNGNLINSSAGNLHVGGNGSTITTTGANNGIYNGSNATISGTGTNGFIGSSQNATVSASGATLISSVNSTASAQGTGVVGGQSITGSGSWSLSFGDTFVCETSGALCSGADGDGSLNILAAEYVTTTNATASYLFTRNGNGIQLPSSSAFHGTVDIMGYNKTDNTIAAYTLNVSGSVAANGVVTLTTGAITSTAVGTPTYTPAIVPFLDAPVNNMIHVRVQGTASKTVKWRALFKLSVLK